jgi:hypothetical protein
MTITDIKKEAVKFCRSQQCERHVVSENNRLNVICGDCPSGCDPRICSKAMVLE